jgi:hypothetical protein
MLIYGKVVQVTGGSKSVKPTEVVEREGGKLYMDFWLNHLMLPLLMNRKFDSYLWWLFYILLIQLLF